MYQRPFSRFLIISLLLLGAYHAQACGYGFVGDCSTQLKLRINNTLDSFILADCPFGHPFNGLDLGNIKTLSLAGGNSITWESCQNNVSAVNIRYRVYQQGQQPGAWQSVGMPELYNTVVGPYTTRYRGLNTNINLVNGLSIGQAYFVEVVMLAEIDTIGNDFIPETTLLQDNNGQSFKLKFIYGGPNAPAFTVVNTTVKGVKCFGEQNGSVGVSVYGDQSGLFYQWAGLSNNFPSLYNLGVGIYNVTVSGSSGYSQISSLAVTQPAALSANFNIVPPASCNQPNGSVSAQVSGGSLPYRYQWSTADTNAVIIIQNPGTYTLTVTDAHGCTKQFTAQVTGTGGNPQKYVSATICKGEAYLIDNQIFTTQGAHNYLKPATSGCDTLVYLTLNVLNPGAALANLPQQVVLSCNTPLIQICADAIQGVDLSWSKDPFAAVPGSCINVAAAGEYHFFATEIANGKQCTASKNFTAEEHFFTPAASIQGIIEMSCVPGPDSTLLHASTMASNPTYEWKYQGQIISTSVDCKILFDLSAWPLELPTLNVTDQYGCSTVAISQILIIQNVGAPYISAVTHNLCDGLYKLEYQVYGGEPPYTLSWSSPVVQGSPAYLSPGLYSVTVQGSNGCTDTQNFFLPDFSGAQMQAIVQPSTSSTSANGSIYIQLNNNNNNYDVNWSNGSTSNFNTQLNPGEYCVTLTDPDNCTFDTCFTVGQLIAATEAIPGKINCYPNPARIGSWLEIQLPEDFFDNDLQINIRNIDGLTLMSGFETTDGISFKMQIPPNIQPGFYVIQAQNKHGNMTGKLLFER